LHCDISFLVDTLFLVFLIEFSSLLYDESSLEERIIKLLSS
jgi:hypothetical protein